MFKEKKQKKTSKKQKTKKGKRNSRVPRAILVTGWSILVFSVGFGVYNNITAVSTHTVHEKEVIKEQLVDTTGLQSYTKSFAETYFTVSPLSKDQQEQQDVLKSYFADNLAFSSSLYKEVKERVTVKNVEILKIKEVPTEKNIYSVSFILTLEFGGETILRSYSVDIYTKNDQFLIVKLPVLATLPEKADITINDKLPSSSIEATTREYAEGFLETFFSVYPKADEKELIYYGENLQPIQDNLTFIEITNVQMSEKENIVSVTCTVVYRDNDTHFILEMPYHLTLEKLSDNKFAIKELR